MVKRIADFQQHISVDEAAAKQVMHVLPRASYLLRQPPCTPPLSSKLFFNKVSDMWCFLRGHVLDFENRKSVESIPCLNPRVSTPNSSNKYSTPYHVRHLQLALEEFCPETTGTSGKFGTQGQQQVLSDNM
jgi:hypothetical protein